MRFLRGVNIYVLFMPTQITFMPCLRLIGYTFIMKDLSTLTQEVANKTTFAIELQNVTKRFRTPTGQAYTALRDLSLSVAPGEFCAVVGPTGCGTSTTLSL